MSRLCFSFVSKFIGETTHASQGPLEWLPRVSRSAQGHWRQRTDERYTAPLTNISLHLTWRVGTGRVAPREAGLKIQPAHLYNEEHSPRFYTVNAHFPSLETLDCALFSAPPRRGRKPVPKCRLSKRVWNDQLWRGNGGPVNDARAYAMPQQCHSTAAFASRARS